ncbi:MAG: Osmosensitive channel histidine kinaselike protein [Acidimicrobiia bacterium]|nr:Osmosensitive channel histidine kinaselike protein [Acidimicrobiia bacterium]
MPATRDEETGPFVAAVGCVTVVAVAGLLGQVRSQLGPANVALALALIVVSAAALGGRYAGAVTGAVGALSFDFFHTQPYNHLQIDRAQDVETVVLLLLIGILAGELTHLRVRHRASAQQSDQLLDTVLSASHLASSTADVDEVWEGIKVVMSRELGLADCRFEPFGTEAPPLPRIAPTGTVPLSTLKRFVGHGFELPESGAELAVSNNGLPLGRVVLVPSQHRGVSLRERRVAVALAELLGIAVGRRDGGM